MKLSLLIPVFNEEENLWLLHGQIDAMAKQFALDVEVVLVDDGSTDRSFEVLSAIAAADPRCRVVRFR